MKKHRTVLVVLVRVVNAQRIGSRLGAFLILGVNEMTFLTT